MSSIDGERVLPEFALEELQLALSRANTFTVIFTEPAVPFTVTFAVPSMHRHVYGHMHGRVFQCAMFFECAVCQGLGDYLHKCWRLTSRLLASIIQTIGPRRPHAGHEEP